MPERKPFTLPRRLSFILGFVLAVLASASTWFYVNRILRPQQVAEAAAHSRPRGNLSDLYPRWLGARELLLHGRNPYSAGITREIQQGYYGRPLDPTLPNDPKDQQGFAYPAYVVFLLAPTVNLPFDTVQVGFRWFLVALAAGSILLWLWVSALESTGLDRTHFHCARAWLVAHGAGDQAAATHIAGRRFARCLWRMSGGRMALTSGRSVGTGDDQAPTGVATGACGCCSGRRATGGRGGGSCSGLGWSCCFCWAARN